MSQKLKITTNVKLLEQMLGNIMMKVNELEELAEQFNNNPLNINIEIVEEDTFTQLGMKPSERAKISIDG